MPLYNFATYADAREEWAITADSIDHARRLIGDDPDGSWLDHVVLLEVGPVDRRDEFVLDDEDEHAAIDKITPGHWAWRAANRDYLEHSLRQNIAAISGEFHTSPSAGAFYDAFGRYIDGFVGQYDLCIAMAEALTEWELGNGLAEAYETAGVPWIEVIERYVATMLETALETGALPEPVATLESLPGLVHPGGGS